jgi:hypothetical protein
MSVNTTYSEMADDLLKKIDECIETARQMMDKEIWGYDDYSAGRDLEQFLALRDVRTKIIGGEI